MEAYSSIWPKRPAGITCQNRFLASSPMESRYSSKNGVDTPPGASALTSMLAPATSAATDLVKAMTAPLVAQ
ncbi:hypothetical protein D3C75_1356080 [compost metagenome]